MNKTLLCGRLVGEPDIRYSTGDNATAYGNYTLAVDRKFKKEGQPTADFIRCRVIGKNAEFANNYLHKGMKIIVEGRIETGSYVNREGQKVFTTDVAVESHEFAESKSAQNTQNTQNIQNTQPTMNDVIDIPSGAIEEEELPW